MIKHTAPNQRIEFNVRGRCGFVSIDTVSQSDVCIYVESNMTPGSRTNALPVEAATAVADALRLAAGVVVDEGEKS